MIALSPRQLDGEIKAAKLIKRYLSDNKVFFTEQKFTLNIPVFKKTVLKVDNKKIGGGEANCFVSGKIFGKDNIISSLSSSECSGPNFNFNPFCPAISKSDFYFHPSISVSHKALKRILKGRKVEGEVVVKPQKHETSNIIVGNMKNPVFLCFAHYDSIGKGALDNASGVGLTLQYVFKNPGSLKRGLFIFSAVEEISYDKPIYWGYGFRIFEKKYTHLFKNTKKIVVVDCVGNGEAIDTQDEKFLYLAFPLSCLKKIKEKTHMITGGIENLMGVYHSNLDDGRMIKEKYVQSAYLALAKLLK